MALAGPEIQPAGSGNRGMTMTTRELGFAPERVDERAGRRARPQVLVLEVDESPGLRERVEIPAGDAAFAIRREGEGPTPGRIRAEDLHRVRTRIGGVGRRSLDRELGARGALVHEALDELAPRNAAVERRRVVPPLGEGERDVLHDGAAQLHLEVVPGRARAVVRRGQIGALRVAAMVGAVVVAVAEIDPTDERDIVGGRIRSQEDHDLLVEAAEVPDAVVEPDVAAGRVHHAGELQVASRGVVRV